MAQAQVIGRDGGHALDPVAAGKQIEPSVVVVVEKPRRKTVDRIGDAQVCGHVSKRPGRSVRGFALVAIKQVGLSAARYVDIGPSVVVVVPAVDGFDQAEPGETGSPGDLLKGAIPVVAVELAGIDVARNGFVADEQVDPAVVVEVQPGGGLGGVKTQQTGFLGYVVEGAVSVVAEEGIGVVALFLKPGAPKHQHVEVSIVVVVRLHQVQAAEFSGEARRTGAFLEVSVGRVAKKTERILHSHGRDHQVQIAVVVEIIHDRTSGECIEVKSGSAGAIREPGKIVFRGKNPWWYQEKWRHPVGMRAEGHVGKVEQPARLQVIRVPGELFLEDRDGSLRAEGFLMETTGLNGHQARIDGVVEQAVFLFAEPEVGQGGVHAQQGLFVFGQLDPPFPDQFAQCFKLFDRLPAPACVQEFVCESVAQAHEAGRIGVRLFERQPELPFEHLGRAPVQKGVLHRIRLQDNLAQSVRHPAGRCRLVIFGGAARSCDQPEERRSQENQHQVFHGRTEFRGAIVIERERRDKTKFRQGIRCCPMPHLLT